MQPYGLQEMIRLVGDREHDAVIKFDFERFMAENQFTLPHGQAPFFYFFIDLSRMQYIYMSPGVRDVLGYEASQFLEGGMDFSLKIILAEDLQTMQCIHSRSFGFMYNQPVADRTNLMFSFDYRGYAKDGQIIRLLQQSQAVYLDEEGKPLIDFGVCTDITDYKTSGDIVLKIAWRKKDRNEVVFKETYASNGEVISFSKRELEILKHITQGKTDLKIGELLHISPLTSKVHRRKLLNKTGVKNTAELVRYAMLHGLAD
jgi:DNA-binding CsgD family transcriptional regulator